MVERFLLDQTGYYPMKLTAGLAAMFPSAGSVAGSGPILLEAVGASPERTLLATLMELQMEPDSGWLHSLRDSAN